MRDFNDLVHLIKKTALQAVEASKPTSVVYGTVTSSSPLKINVEQKLTLTDVQLILTQTVNNLSIGDKVIMIRVQGGQEYIVMDRVRV